MKSYLGLALLAGLFPGVALSDSPPLDTYQELVRFRSDHQGGDRSFSLDTRQFLGQLVDDPTAFYDELSDAPRITNEVWWNLYTDSLGPDHDASVRGALGALTWHAGLTKARPGVEVTVDHAATVAYGGREVAANALKAGVDADIFLQAADMNGTMKTVAAGYAVALQILRDQMSFYPPSEYGRRAIKPDVLDRYMAERNPDRISDIDAHYLADLLRYEISRHGASTDQDARHALPAGYRVARVAAAYADRRGYFAAPCSGDGPSRGQPMNQADMEFHQPLCFIAATDRAVQSWYRREMRSEAAALRSRGHEASSPLMHLIGTVLVLVDFVSFIEVIEEMVASDLASTGLMEEADAEFAAERANQLTCRIAR